MKMVNIPFDTTNWDTLAPTIHAGDNGHAIWRTLHVGDIRVRMVEYTPGYVANHWCQKGHILQRTGHSPAMRVYCLRALARALGHPGVGCAPEQLPASAGGDVTRLPMKLSRIARLRP